MWGFRIEKSILITATTVSGKLKIVVDKLSCLVHQSTKWSLNHSIFRQVVSIYGPP